eukprot:TRINITY_DN4112_c0_g1_i1.p1 TRINITY_DN4112_c0_g1~~TRINITY_DN4112_c0_g1_i1.p1  ORF type:complete len:410 (-),score=88.04 TRINITY_DN4112_c0_g1_i1:27-1256(-)
MKKLVVSLCIPFFAYTASNIAYSHAKSAQPQENAFPAVIPVHLESVPKSGFHLEAMKYGLPSYQNLTFYETFISSANYERRVPNWVLQCLHKEDLEGEEASNRKHSQFTDKALTVPPIFRASNDAYFGSGYSRGHMVPAGDTSKKSQSAMNETFILNSNIIPQHHHNNSHFWYRLETYVHHTLVKGGNYKSVRVVSGPCFLPIVEQPLEYDSANAEKKAKRYVKYQVLGEAGVAVPSHIFKVILIEPFDNNNDTSQSENLLSNESESEGGQKSNQLVPVSDKSLIPSYQKPNQKFLLSAFLIPNDFIPANKELKDFEVPLSFLEKHTGLIFFPFLNRDSHTKSICESTSCEMMSEEGLERWNYARRINWANSVHEVDAVLLEIKSKGRTLDERTLNAYNKKKEELSKGQ